MATDEPLFKSADAFQDDVLALPVDELESATSYYVSSFGMSEVSRSDDLIPQVVLERDGVRIGFAVNGGDSSQDGAAVHVTDVFRARESWKRKASKSRTGESTSETESSSKCFSLLRLMASATTSTNHSLRGR